MFCFTGPGVMGGRVLPIFSRVTDDGVCGLGSFPVISSLDWIS